MAFFPFQAPSSTSGPLFRCKAPFHFRAPLPFQGPSCVSGPLFRYKAPFPFQDSLFLSRPFSLATRPPYTFRLLVGPEVHVASMSDLARGNDLLSITRHCTFSVYITPVRIAIHNPPIHLLRLPFKFYEYSGSILILLPLVHLLSLVERDN